MGLLFQIALATAAIYALYGFVWTLWSGVLGRPPPKIDKVFHVIGITAFAILVSFPVLFVVVLLTGGGNWGF